MQTLRSICSRLRPSLSAAVTVVGLLASLTLAAAEPLQSAAFQLRDGDRIVFFGDSITEQANYTRPIEVYLRTRCPQLDISCFNAGWSGDRAWGGDGGMLEERVERDIIAYRPSVVTVMLGMNDGYYTNHRAEAQQAFEERIETLISILSRELPGVRISLVGSSPYDNVTPGAPPEWERSIENGYNSVVSQYANALQKLAKRHHLLFVDMNGPLVAALNDLQAADPQLARQLIPDRIHPGPAAGMLMAARLIKAWHAPDSGRLMLLTCKGAPNGTVSVEQTLSLPFPIDSSDPLIEKLVAISPELGVFDGNKLRVVDSPHERIRVEVDGVKVGVFSRSELEHGINLTPPTSTLGKRAADVVDLIALRNEIEFLNWRHLRVLHSDDMSAILKSASDELATAEQRLENIVAKAAEPTPHVIQVTGVAE
jgi:lysophospholipase L1-like esterase